MAQTILSIQVCLLLCLNITDIVDPGLENKNTRGYLDSLKVKISEYLRFLNGAPSVQMSEIPPSIQGRGEEGDSELHDLRDSRNVDIRAFDGPGQEDGMRGTISAGQKEYYRDERDH